MTSFSHAIEPLEPELWFSALSRLADRRQASGSDGIESMLRHAFHLAQLTPGPLRGTVRCERGEEHFEVLLREGALDAAALALVGFPLCFELICTAAGGQRLVKAVVTLSEVEEHTSTATCSTVGGALLGAWCLCLAGLRRRSLQEDNRSPHQAPHTTPGAPRPKSIGH